MPRSKSFIDEHIKPNIGVYSYPKDGHKTVTTGQFEFDVSTFRDPSGQKTFAGLNGLDKYVIEWVGQDRRVAVLIRDCKLLAEDLVRPKLDGKSICEWFSIAFKDHHGKWIAPAIAEIVADALSNDGFNVAVYHSELRPS